MAHFAELKEMTDPTGFTSDTHLVVQRVVVVGNDIPANGGILEDNDMHVDGETWCVNFIYLFIYLRTSSYCYKNLLCTSIFIYLLKYFLLL